MRDGLLTAALALALVAGLASDAAAQGRDGRGGGAARGGRGGGLIPPLLMKTDAFEDGGIIPERYAGRGGNRSAATWKHGVRDQSFTRSQLTARECRPFAVGEADMYLDRRETLAVEPPHDPPHRIVRADLLFAHRPFRALPDGRQ